MRIDNKDAQKLALIIHAEIKAYIAANKDDYTRWLNERTNPGEKKPAADLEKSKCLIKRTARDVA